MKTIIFILFVLSTLVYSQNPCLGTLTVSYAGKTYNTVQIGTQCWLKENLDVGTMVQGNQNQTNNGTIEKYCYDNNPSNCVIYGGLYQWAEVVQYKNGATNSTLPNPAFIGNVQGICPSGWHIPTDAELQTLVDITVSYIGPTLRINSNVLKATNQGTGQGIGTNTSGFSALLSGDRWHDGGFYNLGDYTGFWSSTSYTDNAGIIGLSGSDADISGGSGLKIWGQCVRCLMDGFTAVGSDNEKEIPTEYLLYQNYPNPFNPTTAISWRLAVNSYVKLKVFDILGNEVATLVDEFQQAGNYVKTFHGMSLTSGVYIYKIEAGKYSDIKKMILIK